MCLYQVLVELEDFHYAASFIPLEGVWACLVLDADMVTNFESGQAFSMF